MTELALIRHGPTDWNARKLVQGRSDVPLSADGRDRVAGWTLPGRLDGFDWVSSPLSRCAETARILTGQAVQSDVRLVEMAWGEWEGCKLGDLRARLGDLMAAWEARGLDFQAPGGESPRDVQARVQPFLHDRARSGRPTVAVCHKGVIRAIYAKAVGWDMTCRPPTKLDDNCVHLFVLDGDGTPAAATLNIAL